MHEVAQAIGWLSAVVLIVAVGAWLKLLFRPALQRLDGRPPANGGRFEAASQLIVLAVGLSSVAAILAIASLFMA